MEISIRAPREGGDGDAQLGHAQEKISIRAPREGGDVFWWPNSSRWIRFQSTPPARGAT